MNKGLHRLAHQVGKYQEKVQALKGDFEELCEALEDAEHRFEALETDYGVALDAVEVEKETARYYYRHLRNAELEIRHLRMALPDDYNGPAVGGWSQAKC
jgi:chromosome segregation ATPase